jgi:hypothetical protein
MSTRVNSPKTMKQFFGGSKSSSKLFLKMGQNCRNKKSTGLAEPGGSLGVKVKGKEMFYSKQQ